MGAQGHGADSAAELVAPQAPPRVAFLCFYPDLGHVIPLLKIAKAAQDAGLVVRCYFPERCLIPAERYGVPVFPLKLESAAGDDVFKTLGSKSIFFLTFSGYSHSTLLVDPPIVRSVVAQADAVVADVVAFGPDVVVGDVHLFRSLYEAVAQRCGAQYVSNNPSGILAHLYRKFVAVYGDGRTPGVIMATVEAAGGLFGALYRRAFYLLHLPRWVESRAAKKALQQKIDTYRGGEPSLIWSLTVGLSWVEERFLQDTPKQAANPQREDLPPLSSVTEPLPPDLEAWLARSEEPVVYISFGSILGLNEDTYRAMGAGLRQLGCRVVWSTPVGEAGVLSELARDPNFYVARYVPQAQLLKRKELSCFVTHGGASSVQEAMLGGVPMLCVPLHADNGYISWLVRRLGIGQRVWKRELGKPAFVETITELISNRAYKERAGEIAAVLNSTAAEQQVARFLERGAARGEKVAQ